ncbi:MAG: S8 family serine peptidase, partial [Methylibium sp.]|uniref:S8 family serine peptidase n=1 Tax=Methylibium sp. TaxID=2067992 RepID=UPI0017B1387C
MAKSSVAAARRDQTTFTLRPGEIVPRGRAIEIRFPQALAEEARRGITLAGQRVDVHDKGDGRSFAIDTSGLAPGSHRLRIDEPWAARGSKRLADVDLPFEIVDTPAPLPEDCVVIHAARMRIGELQVERLAMNGQGEGAWLDAFKAVHRKSGQRMPLAFDEAGRKVDLERELRRLAQRRQKTYGALHPSLHQAIGRRAADEPIEVAVWLRMPETVLADKPLKGRIRRRPEAEERERAQWQAQAKRFAEAARRYGLEVARLDPAAPLLYGRIPAGQVAELAASSKVAAVFLHETEGFDDLGDSIAIANSDDAHADGFTGAGVNVAVYERGPDNTANLPITARFESDPDTSQHSRHVHGIIRNTERRAPNGHAPGCNLHSANSYDLDAIRWAAEDRGCTVISQSFHRDSEQTSSGLSFDDIYKDHLALRWPYPTICEAAGNGATTEYVNHKGFNRLTVGNHNDTASGMAGDSVFRNPASSHGDRELPEIAANGTGVTAVGVTDGGTSMATPAVAGAAALIQQANATLQSWPEGCRAILMAAAWRNPAAGTWRADVIAGVDAADGAG